jgi:uncharacterized protein
MIIDWTLLLMCFFAFLAGFIDSIVGGGGFVQVPALFILYPHFSVSNVIATNRLASVAGTSVAAWNYVRKVSVPWSTVIWTGSGAAFGAYWGAYFQSFVAKETLKPLILVIIAAIALYTFRKKEIGQEEQARIPLQRLPLYAVLLGLLLGFYNGFIGPGTGTLLVFGLVSWLGYSFLKASATAKLVNVIADVSSLIMFFIQKQIVFKLALPMMACNVAGSYIGSKMAILRGNQFIRQVFLWVITALILRFAYDVIQSWYAS